MKLLFPIFQKTPPGPGGNKKKRKPAWSGTSKFIEQSPYLRILILLLLGVGAILFISFRGRIIELPLEGIACDRDILAPIDFSCPDETRTEELRRLAAEREPFGYVRDQAVLFEQNSAWKKFISNFSTQDDLSELDSEISKLFHQLSNSGVLAPEVKQELEESGHEQIALAKEAGIPPEIKNLADTLSPQQATAIAQKLIEENSSLSQDKKKRVLGFVEANIRPNLMFDLQLTRQMRKKAEDRITPVIKQVRRGDRIVGAGETVTKEVIFQLRVCQEEQRRHNPVASQLMFAIGTAILVSLILGVGGLFLKQYSIPLLSANSSLLLIALVSLFSLGITRLLVQAWWHIDPSFSVYLRYLSPISGAIFIICLLLGPEIAVTLALVLAAWSILIANLDAGLFISWSLQGLAAAYFIQGARRRGDILRAGGRVALVAILSVISLGLLRGLGSETILKQAAGAAGGTIVCALAVISLLGIIEACFRRCSDIGLLELSDMNHPLLKDLMLKAPGTHHHSLMVASLAETTAEAIGANPLLCRVGALFHDIGKIAKPEYFVENIIAGPNFHDRLIPSMSSLILISHVKEGVDLAGRHRLDRRIIDIIQQHHGTSLISYFFDRAERTQQLKFDVLEKDFRYPGPPPQTPEAAVIMLCDAIEAASVAMDRPTPARIEHLVRTLIQERFVDAQLDESGLSLNDLKVIAEVLTRNLTARFHSRIKYPGEEEKNKNAPEDPPDE